METLTFLHFANIRDGDELYTFIYRFAPNSVNLKRKTTNMTYKSTGIFFHYQHGERLKDFPSALDGILDKDNVMYCDALYDAPPDSIYDIPPVPLSELHEVHSSMMIEQVKQTGAYEGALYSVAGTVSSALKICSGEITNAFVFTGYGDHHAGRNFFGGGCYFNGAAIAAHIIKKSYNINKFAVIDTDAHHGDGSWNIFESNPDALYLCFCSGRSHEKNNNVDMHVRYNIGDRNYLDLAEKAFEKYIKQHKPEIIFWNWGYDGTIGDYGDMGLTPELHPMLALKIRQLAEDVCFGRLITILCGGSRRDLACRLIPEIIKVLAHLENQ